MNYYPFHIGDYASATRHLTWDEDAAYRRLLDVYYTLEKAIPAAKVYRLVVSSSKVQRQAVDDVLKEFFTLTDAGWMHERCEAELDSMRVKQLAQEDKDRHETERMRRYRDRRATMFEALRAVDIVPAWDVPMKELQRLFDSSRNAPAMPPATDLQREQVPNNEEPATRTEATCNAPATAISTNTNTNTNTSIKEKKSASAPSIPDVADELMADFLKIRKAKKAPLTKTAIAGIEREAGKAGLTMTEAITVCVECNWQGFNADWYAERKAGRGTAKPAQQAESFAERDSRHNREEWERMSGRKWPEDDLPSDARPVAPLAFVVDENLMQRIA